MMKFKEGTTVYTVDGKKVGDIERFVLDPGERKVIGLVVRKGFLFTEDKVVPVDKVETASEERVVLRADVDIHTDLPPYEVTEYVTPSRDEIDAVYDAEYFDPIYYYPAPSTSTWYGAGLYGLPAVPVEKQNIPDDAVALEEGADVISRDGKDVGNVSELFTDSTTGQITHFAVKRGLLFKEEKVIPAGWVEDMMNSEVHLAVDSKTLGKLRDM